METSKRVVNLLNKKAESNNAIDLNAYALGLEDMEYALLERYNEAIEALKFSNRSLSKYNSEHAIHAYLKNDELIKKSEQ